MVEVFTWGYTAREMHPTGTYWGTVALVDSDPAGITERRTSQQCVCILLSLLQHPNKVRCSYSYLILTEQEAPIKSRFSLN